MTTLDLDGIIGWDVMASDVRAALAAAAGPVQLRINSPGGDVHEGIAIANALRQFQRDGGEVQGIVTGVAASMASYIAMFANELAVEDNAVMMLHNPWAIAVGDYRAMTKTAEVLGGLRNVLATGYCAKCAPKKKKGEVLDAMDQETWLYGEEIVSAGYADSLVAAGDGPEDRVQAMALASNAWAGVKSKLREREADGAWLERVQSLLGSLPEAVTTDAPSADATTATDRDLTEPAEGALATGLDEEATLDEDQAKAANLPAQDATAANPDPDPAALAAQARLEGIAAERARVSAIGDLCARLHELPRAAGYIAAGLSLEETRAALIEVWAASAGPEIQAIDPTLSPSPTVPALQRSLFNQVAKGTSV